MVRLGAIVAERTPTHEDETIAPSLIKPPFHIFIFVWNTHIQEDGGTFIQNILELRGEWHTHETAWRVTAWRLPSIPLKRHVRRQRGECGSSL